VRATPREACPRRRRRRTLSPGWPRLELRDDSRDLLVSDRERRGPVGLYWAGSESGLRPTTVQKVGGEGDKGARVDFRGRAWPK
jgi:hypothetical protein